MKKMLLTSICLCMLYLTSNAQLYYGQESDKVTIYAFKTDLGYGLKAGYAHYFNPEFSLEPALVYDYGRPFQTKYKSIGLDLGINYMVIPISQSFLLNLKLSGSVLYETLSEFTPAKKSVLNYGGKGGAELVYNIGNDFGIGLYALQGYMLKKDFGNTRYEAGFTLKLNIQ